MPMLTAWHPLEGVDVTTDKQVVLKWKNSPKMKKISKLKS